MLQYNGQVLAYIGDALLELIIREHLVLQGITKTQVLHDKVSAYTSALGQQRLLDKLMPQLTEEEIAIVKRGRNAPLSRKSRKEEISVYMQASGFEALFGYLHLHQENARIEALFKIIQEVL